MLDVIDALDLLAQCRHTSAPRRPPRRFCPVPGHAIAASSSAAHVDDIVAAFVKNAMRPHASGCSRTAAGHTPGVHLSRWKKEPLTLGAVAVLCAAESARRRGALWSECIAAAEHAAIRLLDVLPDRLWTADLPAPGEFKGLTLDLLDDPSAVSASLYGVPER
jgi:hypothetical protein